MTEADATPRRRFNQSERVSLFLASGGKCSACGDDLPASWHADHVTPFAKGGVTDVVNGRALCPPCNLKKGDRMPMTEPWPHDFALRAWQVEAYRAVLGKQGPDCLISATPGAGKTAFGLYVASRSMMLGTTRRLVVVVPTDHLRKQWLEKASRFGIQLDDAFTNKMKGGEAADYDGVVVTYAQVANEPTLHRALCGAVPTFVIFDEIHHAGSQLHWGRNLKLAFEPAVQRLAITGTPFRSDNNPIPFVHYGADGKCVTDSSYGYGEAVKDRVCREVYFPSFEGRLRWWHTADGEKEASFRDKLSEDASRRRLDTALDPRGQWIRTVLQEAHEQLLSVRRDVYQDAAGLVVAKDITHAKALCVVLQSITGEAPALAVSDDPEASRVIDDFARVADDGGLFVAHPKQWIVAVKMISEGVDIPRLFVSVYATNVMTELYFRQFVGRVVRMMPDIVGQVGYVYIPRDPVLVAFVQAMKEERRHAIDQMEEREEQERQQRLLDAERATSTFTPYGDSEAIADEVFFDGVGYSQSEITEARAIMREAGLNGHFLSDIEVARFMRVALTRMGHHVPPPDQEESPRVTKKPLRKVKDQLRDDMKLLVGRFVGVASRGSDSFMSHRFAYQLLNHATNCRQDQATEDQLNQRKEVLKGWIELAQAAETPLAEFEWWEVARDARGHAA